MFRTLWHEYLTMWNNPLRERKGIGRSQVSGPPLRREAPRQDGTDLHGCIYTALSRDRVIVLRVDDQWKCQDLNPRPHTRDAHLLELLPSNVCALPTELHSHAWWGRLKAIEWDAHTRVVATCACQVVRAQHDQLPSTRSYLSFQAIMEAVREVKNYARAKWPP